LSTQDLAKKIVSQFPINKEEILFVKTKHQYEGRGQRSRSWVDTGGSSLKFSMVCRLNDYKLGHSLMFFVCSQIATLFKGRVFVKWPNDLGCYDQLGMFGKCGGILVEAFDGDHYVVGVGINVSHEPKVVESASSLTAMGVDLNSEEVYQAIKYRLVDALEELVDFNYDNYFESFLKANFPYTGSWVFKGESERLCATDICRESGRLVLKRKDGSCFIMKQGEFRFDRANV